MKKRKKKKLNLVNIISGQLQILKGMYNLCNGVRMLWFFCSTLKPKHKMITKFWWKVLKIKEMPYTKIFKKYLKVEKGCIWFFCFDGPLANIITLRNASITLMHHIMTLVHVVFVLSNLCYSHLVVMTHKRLYIIANKKKVASSNWFRFNNINNLVLSPPLLLVYLSLIVTFHLYLKYLCVLCFNETKKRTRNLNEAM
jgi:hypothetical protein